jgi:hypothetical protein
MVRCIRCGQGINSTYIRVGEKSLLKKVGFYCTNCDTHYDFNQKPYTTNEKPYTVGGRWSSLVKIPPQTWREKEGIRTPLTVNENEIITKRAEMGRVGFEPTTPAMSRRYLNQARPPALLN